MISYAKKALPLIIWTNQSTCKAAVLLHQSYIIRCLYCHFLKHFDGTGLSPFLCL